MVERRAIVDEARTWLGTPWVHLARVKGVGVDCLGLIGMSALACGVEGARAWRDDPAMHNYGRVPQPAFLRASCARFMQSIPIPDATCGDVLVMRFRRYPQHFALVSGCDRILHAYQAIGEVCENGVAVSGAAVVAALRFRGVV